MHSFILIGRKKFKKNLELNSFFQSIKKMMKNIWKEPRNNSEKISGRTKSGQKCSDRNATPGRLEIIVSHNQICEITWLFGQMLQIQENVDTF